MYYPCNLFYTYLAYHPYYLLPTPTLYNHPLLPLTTPHYPYYPCYPSLLILVLPHTHL